MTAKNPFDEVAATFHMLGSLLLTYVNFFVVAFMSSSVRLCVLTLHRKDGANFHIV